MPTPKRQADPATHRSAQILRIDPDQPLVWIVLGFRDFCHKPLLSMAHGLVMALGGLGITWLAHDRYWLLCGLITAFMVLCPVLATGLYAMSRAIERGEPVHLHLLVDTWTRWHLQRQSQAGNDGALIRFGLLLALSACGWILISSAFIQLVSPVPIGTPMDFLREIVASHDSPVFELWLGLGGLMAAPLFASSVVSMPMLLDRQVTVFEAVLTSWQCVLSQPITMALWAFMLMGFMVLGIFSLFVGLILVVPILGHASWHAYRSLVDGHHGSACLNNAESEAG